VKKVRGKTTSWMTIGFLLILTGGSVAFSISTVPVHLTSTGGRLPSKQINTPLEATTLPTMLLTASDFGSGVESDTSVPSGDLSYGGATDGPSCLKRTASYDSALSTAGMIITLNNGTELQESLAAFQSIASAHQSFQRTMRALQRCRQLTYVEVGQRVTAWITRGIPNVGKQGDELSAFQVVVSGGAISTGLDLILVRKGVVDVAVVLAPLADNSLAPGGFTSKALAKIGAPVPVSST